jgi:hypothetical protein
MPTSSSLVLKCSARAPRVEYSQANSEKVLTISEYDQASVMKTRSLYKGIWDDLSADKAMVLLAGPRQSGKTTFARKLAGFSGFVEYSGGPTGEEGRR